MRTILKGLGFSNFESAKLEKEYGEATLRLLDSEEGRKELVQSVDSASVEKASIEYCRIYKAEKLFGLLEPCKFSKEIIFDLFKQHGENEEESLDAVKADPYGTVYTIDAPFAAAEKLAKELGVKTDREDRYKAAVYSVLGMAEKGADDADESNIGKFIAERAGSMCLPFSDAITAAVILLGKNTNADEVTKAAHALHRQKAILLTKKQHDGKSVLFAYRARSAGIEFFIAKKLKERLQLAADSPIQYRKNPFEAIDAAQARLGLRLSYEQSNAVYSALTNRISVITGGPGTGKTATQKVMLEAYKELSRNKPVLLMAPTGAAAKRMSQATGYPASTVHSALGINPAEKDLKAGKDLNPGLIILDETSMVDAPLFSMLLRHTDENTILVIVGDVDQLPSIGEGAILREVIGCVPTTRLTKVFRQGDDSDIAHNAARIKVGTTKMIEGEKFFFIEASNSDEIQAKVCEEYKRQVELVGADNVVVLTPYRRSTPTGVNALNNALRDSIGKASKHYVKYDKIKIYEGDKIIYLRNKYGLVNGEVGFVEEIKGDKVRCKFEDKELLLSGTELSSIVPAYSQTVHKSQGAEYPVVILVADPAHERLNSKKLVYTAVTRAKDKLICVGAKKEAFEKAIERESLERFSNLASITTE